MTNSQDGREAFIELRMDGTTLNVSPTGDTEGGDPGHVVISAFPSVVVEELGKFIQKHPGIDAVSTDDVSGSVVDAVSEVADRYDLRFDGA